MNLIILHYFSLSLVYYCIEGFVCMVKICFFCGYNFVHFIFITDTSVSKIFTQYVCVNYFEKSANYNQNTQNNHQK